ncbi:hypothetical protein [Mesorhizobium sp. M0254]|uniref:hypothetical protein n=1 Tax=Mesorhizobium sp. M0254 TaxID=2956927 RepID=UPI003336DED3
MADQEIPADVLAAADAVMEEIIVFSHAEDARHRIAYAILAERERHYGLMGAIRTLAEVHLKDAGTDQFAIQVGARPEFWHDQQRYVDAWTAINDTLRPSP